MNNPVKPGAAKPRTARRLSHRLGRGSLWLIAAVFTVSGVLRLVEGSGLALATIAGQDPGPATAEAGECTTQDGVLELLAQIRLREAHLDDREGVLVDREQALNLAEGRIEQRLAELIAAEEKLAATVSIADRAADEDVARLVTVYENMKPREAAPLFEEMAPEFAAGFLARMRPDAAAAVLASLEPKIGYTISVLMAGRNAGAPKD